MILIYIIAGLVQLAVPVLIVLGVIWLVRKFSSGPKINYTKEGDIPGPIVSVQTANERTLRAKIADEIRAQLGQYKTEAQKKVVEDMAQTVEYFSAHDYLASQLVTDTTSLYTEKPESMSAKPVEQITSSIPTYIIEEKPYETPWKKLQVLDGAVILLYLGAFFVLASIGLYVGLGAGTTIKAILVTLLTGVFYGAGMSLYTRSKRLKPAGMAFVAIGMATLPMAGAAIFYFGFGEKYGSTIWLITSIAAIALYGHAMYKLRSPLVSYMVVFSTLSVVLSGISSLGLAPYYFIQGMGFAGLLFVIIGRLFKNFDHGIREAYEQSAMFLVPFSLALGVIFVTKVGWLQFSISLLVGAMYYAYSWLISASYKFTYSLLAQIIGIASILTGIYGFGENTNYLAVGGSILALIYIAIWSFWGCRRESSDVYRLQVKSIVLSLPFVAVFSLILAPGYIWMATIIVVFASTAVYIKDRDAISGLGWLLGLMALPSLIGFLAINQNASIASVGLWYVAIMAASVFARLIFVGQMTTIDMTLQQMVLYGTLLLGAFMQSGTGNTNQLIVAIIQIGLFVVHSIREDDKTIWLVFSSVVQLAWLVAFIDNSRVLFAYTAGILLYNLMIAQYKVSSVFHDWLVGISALTLPLMYGLLISDHNWGVLTYWVSYTSLFVIFIGLRYAQKIVDFEVSRFFYLLSIIVSLVLAYFVGPIFGIVVSTITTGLFLIIERLEESSLFGYLAVLLPLGIVYDQHRTAWQGFISICVVSFIGAVICIWRKRQYEAFVSILGILTIPVLLGRIIYDWPALWLSVGYLSLTVIFMAKRLLLKLSVFKTFIPIKPIIQIGYLASLTIGTVFGVQGSWMLMSVALFAGGLLMMAMSYIEDSPLAIVGAFLYGYASILRYTTGLEITITEITLIVIALSQGTYWVLAASRLATVRAVYARGFQLAVAAIIPMIGLSNSKKVVFPVSLAFFSLMLMKEIWRQGQTQRESSLLVLHGSILWLIYTLGVREIQIYTQSTALVIGLFAYWRRKIEDTPAAINRYLWIAVLIFSIPMVWQAIASSNSAYSYLVLVEHTIMIVISIAFKRATFAWWGIAVVVASVLYQLRELRYAALAFLGAFIISLAVYFLLRYNKPDDPKK